MVIKVEKVKVQESVGFLLAKLCKEVLILSLHNSENNFRAFPYILNSQINSLSLQIILFYSSCSLKCSHGIFNSSALTAFFGPIKRIIDLFLTPCIGCYLWV